jgi:hypothetical protein
MEMKHLRDLDDSSKREPTQIQQQHILVHIAISADSLLVSKVVHLS